MERGNARVSAQSQRFREFVGEWVWRVEMQMWLYPALAISQIRAGIGVESGNAGVRLHSPSDFEKSFWNRCGG